MSNEFLRSITKKVIRKSISGIIKKIGKSRKKTVAPPAPQEQADKTHPWRLCPVGEHWVRTHPLTVPPSAKNPDGDMTTRHGHCAGNPSDLIKALVASESGFKLKPKDQKTKSAGMAHGFIQLTDQAIEALNDPKGELVDHLVKLTKEEASDPNISLAAGIRWLFRKKDLASYRLERPATWMEAIAEYKGYLAGMIRHPGNSHWNVRHQ